MLALWALLTVLVVAAPPAGARAGRLQQNRATAKALAREVAGLDARIDAAVSRYARATRALEAVRGQIAANRRLQGLARQELEVARATLAARAVDLYKHSDVTALDAVFSADDFGELVSDLTMVRALARSDSEIVHTIEATRRQLADRARELAADEHARRQLAKTRKHELATISTRLDERRAALAGVRSDVRRMALIAATRAPGLAPTVKPPPQGAGSGPWWPLIQGAAAADGVSARGMYRLMMIESGGSATIVGPGGYCGLFQYAPTTWRGSWNPWRSAAIGDGAAQIKATALAIREGHGHAWWDPSFSWAFQGE